MASARVTASTTGFEGDFLIISANAMVSVLGFVTAF
jgi:hypothetical protein